MFVGRAVHWRHYGGIKAELRRLSGGTHAAFRRLSGAFRRLSGAFRRLSGAFRRLSCGMLVASPEA